MDTASDIKCWACHSQPFDNRQCPACEELFCRACIAAWYLQNNNCPSCEVEQTLSSYTHDAGVEKHVLASGVPCPFCNATVPTQHLHRHKFLCLAESISCPYEGCDVKMKRRDMDAHIVSCTQSKQYNVEDVLDRVCQRSTVPAVSGVMSPELVATVDHAVATQQHDTDSPSNSIYHVVADADSLSSLAVRYDCTREALLKLNKTSVESQLLMKPKILVPKPLNWTPSSSKSVIPFEVMLALKKTEFTRKVVQATNVSKIEAVTYLHMASYDPKAAIELAQEDEAWAISHADNPHRSMAAFLKRHDKPAKVNECADCAKELTPQDNRSNCSACGQFFCHDCHMKKGQCTDYISKGFLGVTSPDGKGCGVAVCKQCVIKHCLAAEPLLAVTKV
eukprot:m.30662 g.30662  ORF g.30662 m.30662 type:complete len:392 (+) comp9311_c0_seq1:145-1320(+)